MANRYVKQLEFQNTIFLSNCPIAIEKGAVLLDTKSNKYFLQLKLGNKGSSSYNNINICVEAFDCDGNRSYSDLEAIYDEIVESGTTFGTKQLLPIPNNNAVLFRIYVENISDDEGNISSFSHENYQETQIENNYADQQTVPVNTMMSKLHEPLDNSKWHKKWYHLMFAFIIVLNIALNYNWAIIYHAPLLIWLFPWISIGKRQILKRSLITAILIPLTNLLMSLPYISYAIQWGNGYASELARILLKLFLINIIPFLFLFFNAKRHKKPLCGASANGA